MNVNVRKVEQVAILDLTGAGGFIGEVLYDFRNTVRITLNEGFTQILLNMENVTYLDSSESANWSTVTRWSAPRAGRLLVKAAEDRQPGPDDQAVTSPSSNLATRTSGKRSLPSSNPELIQPEPASGDRVAPVPPDACSSTCRSPLTQECQAQPGERRAASGAAGFPGENARFGPERDASMVSAVQYCPCRSCRRRLGEGQCVGTGWRG